MRPAERSTGLVTLEPLIEAVREGVVHAGWSLSGLQKTTSHEFEGRWAGDSTRSAYLFFHRDDLPESVSVEAYLDETSRGLRGNLALVLEGPRMDQLGPVEEVITRVTAATRETIPEAYRRPVSLRLSVSDGAGAWQADVQVRIKIMLPSAAVDAGMTATATLCSSAVADFEALLERPEIAELLPPVVE